MSNYKNFSKYYDLAMGDRTATGNLIENYIKQYNPLARTILELGCGTGAFLKYFFDKNYEISGIDLSPEMLEIARQKLPAVNVSCQNMASFSLASKYDVVLCLFDSINHLIDYDDWERIFDRVDFHLNNKGIFIFDINTQMKLETLTQSPAMINEVRNKVISMTVTKIDDVYNWNIKISDKGSNDNKEECIENIKEQSFALSVIENSLKKIFSKVIINDQNGTPATETSRRVYFICVK